MLTSRATPTVPARRHARSGRGRRPRPPGAGALRRVWGESGAHQAAAGLEPGSSMSWWAKSPSQVNRPRAPRVRQTHRPKPPSERDVDVRGAPQAASRALTPGMPASCCADASRAVVAGPPASMPATIALRRPCRPARRRPPPWHVPLAEVGDEVDADVPAIPAVQRAGSPHARRVARVLRRTGSSSRWSGGVRTRPRGPKNL
jgi:hypothetical protein